MENKNKVWFIICGIVSIITGVAYCGTLILIPFAVYCFIGAKKYFEWAEMTEGQLMSYKKSIVNWAIYISIVGFPLGLVSIVPACSVNNNVTVSSVKEETSKIFSEEPEQQTEKREPVKNDLSDLETLEKLKKLLDEGLITQDEYERAKQDVLKK